MEVEVRTSPLGGRGLFARKNFKAGNTILVEQPLLMVPGLQWENTSAALSDESESSRRIREGK